MKLGIVGLPNVGKSTLFNAITSTKNAEAANYPFCTIEPNSGIVAVPDKRLDKLAEIWQTNKKTPAIIESNQPLYFFQSKLLLADGFFKCHRSYIVNLYRIATYTQKEIQMQSGARIPISRSCHGEFEAAYFDLLFREGEST